MLRKRKPAVPERQAPPPSSSAFAEQMRALAERARWRDELKHADLTKLCEELKRSPDPDKFRQLLGLRTRINSANGPHTCGNCYSNPNHLSRRRPSQKKPALGLG